MTTLKTSMLAIALLAGGTSLAMAQNGLPTGGYPPVMGGAAGNPAVPGPPGPGVMPGGPGPQSAAPATGTRIVHHHIYMSAHHGQQQPKQPQ